MAKMYRYLYKNELRGKSYNSHQNYCLRQELSKRYYPLISLICEFSIKAKISLSSAVKIAQVYKNIPELLNEYISTTTKDIPLSVFNIDNEKEETIPLNILLQFTSSYELVHTKDFDNDNTIFNSEFVIEAIWEYVRERHYSDAPSRFESTIFFLSKSDAQEYCKYEDDITDELIEGELQVGCYWGIYDFNWKTMIPSTCTMSEAIKYAINYWEGKITEHCIKEVVITGKYLIK